MHDCKCRRMEVIDSHAGLAAFYLCSQILFKKKIGAYLQIQTNPVLLSHQRELARRVKVKKMKSFQELYSAAHTDRGWPFGSGGVMPRIAFNEGDFLKNAKIALALLGHKMAWVEVVDGNEYDKYLCLVGAEESIKLRIDVDQKVHTDYWLRCAPFRALPVILRKLEFAALSAPDFWGNMKISKCSPPEGEPHLLEFAREVLRTSPDWGDLHISRNGSAYIGKQGEPQKRFADHNLPT